MKKLNLKSSEIANMIDGQLIGADHFINKFNRLENAAESEITFYSDSKFLDYFNNSLASCVIISKETTYNLSDKQSFILVENPYLAFVKLINYFHKLSEQEPIGISERSSIASGVELGNDVFVADFVSIYSDSIIGNNTKLYNNVCIMSNVKIGNNCKIYPNVTIYEDTIIGDNTIIHSGAVIGGDGFGFTEDKATGEYTKIPQIGNVVIGNNVEIGANSTIDRALVGSTIIGDGVKIDNLCQIAHNCEIDVNSAMAAQVGIAGSTKIGKRVRLGGQVGLSGHIDITDDVIIYAQSGVAKSIEKKGIYFGSPIKDRLTAFKIEAVTTKLPEMARDIEKLKSKLDIK